MENTDNKVYKNRWLILLIVVMATFMSCIDSSIVNVALPVMSKELSVSMQSIEWVVISYLIVISAAILMFGRIGDIKGKTTVFKFGVALFTLGSFLCGISSSLKVLVMARIVQATGAAATMATNQGIITHVFPENERGRALGVIGTFVALGNMIGPSLGGFIISVFNWNYIFLVNIPVGIIVFLVGMKNLPKVSKTMDEDFDKSGSLLFAVSIIFLFGCLIEGQYTGYGNKSILFGFIISLVSFIIFIFVEKKKEFPLVDLKIFDNKLFSISIFCGFTSFVAIGTNSIIQPFYLEDAMKFSPSKAGLIMMIYPVILAVAAPLSGYISDKIGCEFLTFLGLILTSVGLLLMSALNLHSSIFVMAVYISFMAVGNGLFQSPNNSLVMSTVPKSKLGIAGSINALVRNLGIIFGISTSTTLLYNRMSSKIGYKVINYVAGRNDIFIYGMRYVYAGAALICILGAVITGMRLKSRKSEVYKTAGK